MLKENFEALMQSIYCGDLDGVRRAVEGGADVNDVALAIIQKKPVCSTPLALAVRRGYIEITKYLISAGADVNFKDLEEESILGWLIGFPFDSCPPESALEIADILIKSGADVNSVSESQMTPLLYAIGRGNEKMEELLRRHGARMNIDDIIRNEKALMPAILEYDLAPLLFFILSLREDVLIMSREMALLLTRAASAGAADICNFLLEMNVPSDVCDESGSTPLSYAALNGMEQTARRLLKEGADINSVDHNKMTPLHCAAAGRSPALVKFLCQSGADVNAENAEGWTPLHIAVFVDDAESTGVLIQNHADLNALEKEGRTPLMIAYENNHEACIELLSKAEDALKDSNAAGK